MALQSWLPQGGTNLFQQIKAKRAEAEARGVKILNLSIGQPQGPALPSARLGVAEAVMSDEESMHEYQDNGSPGVPEFAEEFVEFNVRGKLSGAEVAYLPIPGIKPMLGLVPLACQPTPGYPLCVSTMTMPGYPTPADWCRYLDIRMRHDLPLNAENQFRFFSGSILTRMDSRSLVMMNYPHNPSGQVMTYNWLWGLCGFCEKYGIRLFNDAAYAPLSHTDESSTLAAVAVNFFDLSWVEAFSASKIISNGTGWRVGAMVGSPDFIQDIATIKGNTDSGFCAFAAAGVLNAIRHDEDGIEVCRKVYEERIKLLIDILTERQMRLAVYPGAGFFTLWHAPDWAFGERMHDAEHFNNIMIEQTGVVGVPFGEYIRYAVCGPVEEMEDGLYRAFEKARVAYLSGHAA